MKIRKIFFVLFLIFSLSSCSVIKNVDENASSNIVKPDDDLELAGIWKNSYIYEINKENKLEKLTNPDVENIFISKTAFDFKKNYVLNPDIISRYIDFDSYILSRFTGIPDEIKPVNKLVHAIKFSNKTSFNQEFILIDNNKIITFYLGKIYVYEKSTNIDKSIESKKYSEIQSLIKGVGDTSKKNFGLSIAFRKRNSNGTQINYDYYTYYIKQTENDKYPIITKVSDIVLHKSTGLWSIVSSISKKTNKNKEGFDNYLLTANPTFLNSTDKLNGIEDTLYRRIDYVNSDYIAVTNFNYLYNEVSETYSIFNMENLSKKEPLSIMSIAGGAGNEAFLTSYKEAANSLFNRGVISVIQSNPDLTNIGIRRVENSWKFNSNIEQVAQDNKSQKVFRKFDLKITPIINIGTQSSNSPFTWSEIKRRRPEAIDATLSPDNNYILIQLHNALEFYPIYYNNIANQPLFTIQNVDNYEIVMTQWITNENIDSIQEEYSKLKKLNSYIIYPQ